MIEQWQKLRSAVRELGAAIRKQAAADLRWLADRAAGSATPEEEA